MNKESPIKQIFYGECGIDMELAQTENQKVLLDKVVEYDNIMRTLLATDSEKLEHYLATTNALDMLHHEMAISNYVDGFRFAFNLAMDILTHENQKTKDS